MGPSLPRVIVFWALVLGWIALPGCVAGGPANPSFALTEDEARAELRAMADAPAAFERPVLVLSGYFDPGIASGRLARKLRAATSTPELVSSTHFVWDSTVEAARQRVIQTALAEFAGGDEARLREMEFDLVGISMGGLIARAAAADGLRVRRIFTLASPHRGAEGAQLPTLDAKVRSMRAGSGFLQRLDRALMDAEYELVCYVRLGDDVVGEINAAPPGTDLIWMPNAPGQFPHMNVARDDRIAADIARRLRGEAPYAIQPAAPLPPARPQPPESPEP